MFQRSCKELCWKGANTAINILYGITPLADHSKPHSAHLIKLEWVFPQLSSLFSSKVAVTTKKEKLQHQTHSVRIAHIFPKKCIMRNSNNSRVILILRNNQGYTNINSLLHVALRELTQPDFLTSTLIIIFLKCLLTSEIKDIFYIAIFFVNMDKRIIWLPIKLASTMRKVRIFFPLQSIEYTLKKKKIQTRSLQDHLSTQLVTEGSFVWVHKLTDACLRTS